MKYSELYWETQIELGRKREREGEEAKYHKLVSVGQAKGIQWKFSQLFADNIINDVSCAQFRFH